MKVSLQDLAGRLMRCPTAPYHEAEVAREVLRICDEHGLRADTDRFGNILVKVNRAPKDRPFVLAAHLDHPGFVISHPKSAPDKLQAEFLGGVPDHFFKPGIKLRLLPGPHAAVLGPRINKTKRIFQLLVKDRPEARPSFGVWELPDFEVRGDRIVGRACDDLVGAATILHVLIGATASKARVNIVGVLSRAEEVGFHGALALAQARTLPKSALIVSLETSRELPPAQMGHGVIIRVGDRSSIFDSDGTRFLTEVAGDLGKGNETFKFQRALMSGGTCEATAYQELGYRCAAVCVALGNYHNCAENSSLGAEFVSISDAENMSALLWECALQMKEFAQVTGRLPVRLSKYAKEAVVRLKKERLELNTNEED